MAAMIIGATLGAAANPVDSGPPGASLVWTSQDADIARARALIIDGRLREAEQALKDAGQNNEKARNEGLEIIRRIRHEYSLEGDALLRKVRQQVPDATAADMERWRKAGEVCFREIDGRIMYFRREPGNIFRFSQEAKHRRESRPGFKAEYDATPAQIEHIRQVLAEADATGSVDVVPVRHRVRYAVTVKPKSPLKVGARVRCWLPFPQEYAQQRDVRLISTSPEGAVIAPNGMKDGRLSGAPQRSVYLEQTVTDPSKAPRFEEEFEYICAARSPALDPAKARALPADYNGGGLGERPPHIVFTPELVAKVREVVGEEKNPLERARRIYHYLDKTIPWCAEQEYCIIPSIAQKGFTAGRGDCGVQSLVFITMCRVAGIPARWQSGWETRKLAWNMHDWAEFYVEPWGWLPVDKSYGLQPSDDPRIREFFFGHMDAYRMIVNLDYGAELHPAKTDMRSEPLDFQRGEVEVDGRNLYFDEWEYEMRFDCEPLTKK